MLTRKAKIVIGALALLFVIAGAVNLFINYQHAHRGNVNINLGVPLQKISIKFNNKVVSPTFANSAKGHYVFILHSERYSVSVTKPGYHEFSAGFDLNPGQTVSVVVNLLPKFQPSATDLSKIMFNNENGSGPIPFSKMYPQGSYRATAIYFSNHSWAFVTMHLSGGAMTLRYIAQYNKSLGQWVLVEGPDDEVELNSSMHIPSDLQHYLEVNGFIGGDDDD